MLHNYLKIAARHLWSHKGYTTLNVVGLGVSMATCLLIGLYVQDELSYDDFHPQAEEIVTITIENDFLDGLRITSYPLGAVLANDVPGIRKVTRTKGNANGETIRTTSGGREIEQELDVLRTDSSFFDVFDGFRLVRGDPARALHRRNEAVISEAIARAYFGSQNPIGRQLAMERDSLRRYTVVGVIEVPENSSIQFDVAIPMEPPSAGQRRWGSFSYFTYALVQPGVTPADLRRAAERAAPEDAERFISALNVLPLSDLYLSDLYDPSGFTGQARYVYIFSTVALLILLIAAINYINLVTAQAEERMREVGVRKTVGASRAQVTRQFLGETVLLSAIALAFAVALAAAALPAFNALFQKNLALGTARHGWAFVNGIGFVLGISLLAGAYPAFVLARKAPTDILRGRSGTASHSGGWLQKGLVVTQFAASAGLILGTVIIYTQLNYLQTKDLGFDGEQVVTVDLVGISESRQRTIREQVANHTEVVTAAIGDAVPGGFGVTFSGNPTDFSAEATSERDRLEIRPAKVDSSYVETLGLDVIAGHSFATRPTGDAKQGYILNESAVKALGWTVAEAVGKPFIFGQAEGDPAGEVIGVIEDFHIESLRTPVSPVVLVLEAESFSSSQGVLAARLAPEGIRTGLDHLRDVVTAVAPSAEFEYTFLDDEFDAMYRSERRLAQVFTGFAFIAIVISCMGLFGLAAFAVQRRTREIGIRKALGASASSIVGLLSKEYALLLAIAFVIGMPVAYLGVQRWLQDFAYRVDIGIGAFALAAGLALVVAGLSVSVHALRAATTDPARVLRTE